MSEKLHRFTVWLNNWEYTYPIVVVIAAVILVLVVLVELLPMLVVLLPIMTAPPRSCEDYADLLVRNIPARCLKYFTEGR